MLSPYPYWACLFSINSPACVRSRICILYTPRARAHSSYCEVFISSIQKLLSNNCNFFLHWCAEHTQLHCFNFLFCAALFFFFVSLHIFMQSLSVWYAHWIIAHEIIKYSPSFAQHNLHILEIHFGHTQSTLFWFDQKFHTRSILSDHVANTR